MTFAGGVFITFLKDNDLWDISSKEGMLQAEKSKIYLIEVDEDEFGIMLQDKDGNNLNYHFSDDTLAIIGTKRGKTKSENLYEVMLVDSNKKYTISNYGITLTNQSVMLDINSSYYDESVLGSKTGYTNTEG